ncbi:SDR family NAD(P)-dependent oxidoreductase [Streptomyces sp. NPDC093982]|uniref:SDR family NAD(P)-dependent oxidoreductase n=1 Tax=Streptomyces sp. NPDC093982 TaxID=3155077 RepID=UPI0034185476
MRESDSTGLPGPWLRWRATRELWTAADIGDLSGRAAVVTGSCRGIGAAVAEHLARHGARVIIACSSSAHGRTAAAAVRQKVASAQVDSVVCELAEPTQVRQCADQIISLTAGRLDLLVNNAAVAAVPFARTADGNEMHFAVNHLGHFTLTGHLLPALLNAPQPRVVNVSSILHWLGRCRSDRPHLPRRYHRWRAYFDSKLANLLFTQGLSAWADTHELPLLALSAHPGLVNTTLGSSALHADRRHAEARLLESMQARWHSPSHAAWPLLRAATDANAANGDFYGPGGRWEWSGTPVRVRAAHRALDARAIARLWDLSQQLTRHSFPVSPTQSARKDNPA